MIAIEIYVNSRCQTMPCTTAENGWLLIAILYIITIITIIVIIIMSWPVQWIMQS